MQRQINHKTMRIIIGAIAILLAPVTWMLSGTYDLASISDSYWSDSRDIFVGALMVVGFYLLAYNGTGDSRDLEFYLSKLACVFAILVALFPTYNIEHWPTIPTWIAAISSFVGIKVSIIHYTAATLLFICLIVMMWFFSNRAMDKGRPNRSYCYRTICILMSVGTIAIYAYHKLVGLEDYVFYIEVWGFTLFGLGWLIAGLYKEE